MINSLKMPVHGIADWVRMRSILVFYLKILKITRKEKTLRL